MGLKSNFIRHGFWHFFAVLCIDKVLNVVWIVGYGLDAEVWVP